MKLNPIDPQDPDLEQAFLFQAIVKTFNFLDEFGEIGLTKTGAFNRKFVQWAADNFYWPEFSREKMHRVNKVLNENDYPPATEVHDLLKHLRLGRHYKGKFVLTKAGKKYQKTPRGLFNLIAPVYLFEGDHCYGWGWDDDRICEVDWDIVLNIVNVEAEHGVSLASLIKTLFDLEGSDDDPYWSDFNRECSNLSYGALLPLVRIGLMQEIPNQGTKASSCEYIKTPLWRKFLRLDTDRKLRPRLVH